MKKMRNCPLFAPFRKFGPLVSHIENLHVMYVGSEGLVWNYVCQTYVNKCYSYHVLGHKRLLLYQHGESTMGGTEIKFNYLVVHSDIMTQLLDHQAITTISFILGK